MKKIMFNDRYGLTQAVLDGKKTMTRRVIKFPLIADRGYIDEVRLDADRKQLLFFHADIEGLQFVHRSVLPYKIGEEVAVAQKYWDLRNCDSFYEALQKADPTFPLECIKGERGCNNKMFVRADWMPHRIRITNIRAERLQDISDGECLKEGITTITEGKNEVGNAYGWDPKIDALKRDSFFTPRAAFAALIDRISGRGTWQRNPWVYAYTFELIR